MRPALALLALLPLAACESGLSTVVNVEVPDAVATAQSATAPGVLVTDAGTVTPLVALCGVALEEPVVFSFDHGFGCLDDALEGTEEVLRAWVQPMPEAWNAAAFCALAPSAYSGISIGADVTGPAATDDTAGGDTDDTGGAADTAAGGATLPPGLASEPDPAWPQGEVTATWKRDFSPCGGVLRGDVRVE